MTEPNWIDITTLGSPYEEQLDANASPDAPESQTYRHRRRSFTGDLEREWAEGHPPRK